MSVGAPVGIYCDAWVRLIGFVKRNLLSKKKKKWLNIEMREVWESRRSENSKIVTIPYIFVYASIALILKINYYVVSRM